MAVSFSLGNRKRSSPWCIFLLLLIGRNNRELCFLGEHCRFSRESVGDVFPGVCGGYPWTEHCLPGGAEREGWHGFINTVIVHVVRCWAVYCLLVRVLCMSSGTGRLTGVTNRGTWNSFPQKLKPHVSLSLYLHIRAGVLQSRATRCLRK